MTNKFILIVAFGLFGMLLMSCQKPPVPPAEVTSPDGKISFKLAQDLQGITYTVFYDTVMICRRSPLALVFRHQAPPSWTLGETTLDVGEENYHLITGKTAHVREPYHQLTVPLISVNPQLPQVTLVIRAFNDGIAFQYLFSPRPGVDSLHLEAEHSTFNLSPAATVHALMLPHYQTSHEGLYARAPWSQLPTDTLLDVPALFVLPDSFYLAITEAALRQYGGMYLSKTKSDELVTKISPRLDGSGLVVSAALPHRSPWRVLSMAKHPGALITSNLLTNLNAPPAGQDWSWLKPGKSTWSWWHGDIIKGQEFPVGLNAETHKYYIDFCARNSIEYHAVIEHGNRAWYYGEGEGFNPPPPAADVTRPVEGLDLPELCAYAKERNVGVRLWVHWKPLAAKLEEAFRLYEQWGISGLMVDFMDRDDQDMVQWVDTVLEAAARHRLHIQFHGAYKPTGLHRTFPHELTKEGVLNLEANKWDNVCDPEHNLIIPFTRMLAGPTDYHAGGFQAVSKEAFNPQFHEPLVMGTRAHYLAMYVVYESYLQLASDFPQAYEGQAGFDFLGQVPTTWDESKVLAAEIGNYLVMARRKGHTWYLGAMNDWTPRELTVSLSFLTSGSYAGTTYADADADDLNALKINSGTYSNRDTLTIQLLGGGGFAARFLAQNN